MSMTVVALCLSILTSGQLDPLPHLASWNESLRGPARLALSDDALYVADAHRARLVAFDHAGNLINTYAVPQKPVGVAVHPDGRIFVAWTEPPAVAIYDSNMTLLGQLGDSADPPMTWQTPGDIDIAQDTGIIYVADGEANRIYGFAADGSRQLTLATQGQRPGETMYPTAVAVDETNDRLIIADHDNFRVQVFSRSGVFLLQFGSRLKALENFRNEGWLTRPVGLAVDSAGHLFLSDALMATVRVFDLTGEEIGKVANYGLTDGGLQVPCDLALDPATNRLFAANTNGGAVEVYDATTVVQYSGDGSRSTAPRDQRYVESPSDGWPDRLMPPDSPHRETSWNGPHLIQTSVLCERCHGITGQPGANAGTVEGQNALCMSCHSGGGRAFRTPVHLQDAADPFATNPLVSDGHGMAHAWGVPAVNVLADSIGPPAGSVIDQFLSRDDEIKCTTCHNQHNANNGPEQLRVMNDEDQLCKQCHAPRDVQPGGLGSHPVGFAYPAGEDEYPGGDAIEPLLLKNGQLQCMTCHSNHRATSGDANDGLGDGNLLRQPNDDAGCRTCHTEHINHEVTGDWSPTCRDCHNVHDVSSSNSSLIAQNILGTPVSFVRSSETDANFVDRGAGPPTFHGICEVCHTTTTYHRNDASGNHGHFLQQQCTDCHEHSRGWLAKPDSCAQCHGEPPDGTLSPNRAGAHDYHLDPANNIGIADCADCHSSESVATHDNGEVDFASGVDANGDGRITLAETDVCDSCHSPAGAYDGVNDPVSGAKANWQDGVYDGTELKPGKGNWCLGCHDEAGPTIDGVTAPNVAGNNTTWGYNINGHGANLVFCTDCHDRTMTHYDGVAKSFSLSFPILGGSLPDAVAQREEARNSYNAGYRLRLVDGQRALNVPRELSEYDSESSRLCFACHLETNIMGVPAGYGRAAGPPEFLMLPADEPRTNYRNESGLAFMSIFYGYPTNIHWDHMSLTFADTDVDFNGTANDSNRTCITCHSPHGVANEHGDPTPAMTKADLNIQYGVYHDGHEDRHYGYIGSVAFSEPGGDLHCETCHGFSGPGEGPAGDGLNTRYYRSELDIRRGCYGCHGNEAGQTGGANFAGRGVICPVSPESRLESGCFECHDTTLSNHRMGGAR